jgi:hypothetical protein
VSEPCIRDRGGLSAWDDRSRVLSEKQGSHPRVRHTCWVEMQGYAEARAILLSSLEATAALTSPAARIGMAGVRSLGGDADGVEAETRRGRSGRSPGRAVLFLHRGASRRIMDGGPLKLL